MNVYDASQDRLERIFKEFDNVYVSFSGGKDSGVLLNLAIDFVRKNYPGRKIGVFHIDYEAQYQMTTDYVDQTLSENSDILDVYRCCLPLSVPCCTSMHQAHWTPWDDDLKDIWVRKLPENSVNEQNHEFPWFKKNMWDYDFQEQFSTWFHKKMKAKRTACLVGIRTQESLNRWRAIHSDKNYHNFKGINWTKKMAPDVFNAYPIYDWVTEDIWTANARFGWSYNKLYDLFYQAGVSLPQMRVASPFISAGQQSLHLYRAIDPNTWGKMIGRVNGVNFTSIYGGTTAMGWRKIKLPLGHTWKSYYEFLLSTLPPVAQDNYKKKLATSMDFWSNRGGCMSADLIEKLRVQGVSLAVKEGSNYRTDKLPVTMEYLDDIDIPEFQSVPTYKRMCVCIMKNDHLCKFMGFSLTKVETEKRQTAETKFKNVGMQNA